MARLGVDENCERVECLYHRDDIIKRNCAIFAGYDPCVFIDCDGCHKYKPAEIKEVKK